MEKVKLLRISELSRKQREGGLTNDEKREQEKLRQEYLAAVRKNLKATLDSIEFKN